MTIIEVTTFDATDAYISDPAGTWKKLKDLYSGLDGLLSFHHGLQIEDPTKCCCFVTWDKLESFNKFTEGMAQEPQRGEPLQLVLKGNTKLHLFDIGSEDVSKLTGAPVTEMTIVNLKEGKTKEDFDAVLKQLDEAAKTINTCHGWVLGTGVKEEGLFAMIMGWDTMEDHLNSVTGNPAYGAMARAAEPVIKPVLMHHTKLQAVEL